MGHLLVPLCCRNAGELVSVNGKMDTRVGGRQECEFAEQEVWRTLGVGLSDRFASMASPQLESKPRSRCAPMCDVPAWRGGKCTCAPVEAKDGEVLSSL